jgi:hypothetical protein
MQDVLLPALQERLGPLTDRHRQLAAVLGLIQIEALVAASIRAAGRFADPPA